MPHVNIVGVGGANFPDDMPTGDIRSFLQKKFSTNLSAAPQRNQLFATDPIAIEGQRLQRVEQEQAALQARRFPDPTQQEPGLAPVLIPGVEDLPGDIAFTAKAIQERDPLGIGIGAASTIIPGLSATKLAAVLPLVGRRGAKEIQETGEKVFKIRTGGADHRIDSDGRVFRFNKNREKWIDLTGTPGEANTLKQLKNIEDAGGLEAFEQASGERAKRIKESIDAQRVLDDETFKLQHQAPTVTGGSGVDGVDVNEVMPDIYRGNGLQLYGTGVAYDQKAINVIRAMKGRPEKAVTIYRAVPNEIKDINPGDWVATTREYARDHLGTEKNWHILTKKVKAKDIATDGNSIHEWGYDPR